MLGKLIKFDMKNLGSNMFPLYLCLAVIALTDQILQMLKDTKFFAKIPAFGYIANTTHILVPIGICLLFLMLLIFGIRYFKDNIMGDQGYLMHTLPVTSYQLVASKVIVVLFYALVTAVVGYLVLAVALGKIFWYQKIYTDLLFFMDKSDAIFMCFLVGIYYLIYYMYLVFAGYLSFSIAYSGFGKHRGLLTGVIFAFLYILGKCGELAMIVAWYFMGIIEIEIEKLSRTEFLYICVPLLIIYLVLNILCFFITGGWLQKRLNID